MDKELTLFVLVSTLMPLCSSILISLNLTSYGPQRGLRVIRNVLICSSIIGLTIFNLILAIVNS